MEIDRRKEYFAEKLSNGTMQEDGVREGTEENTDKPPPSFVDVKRVIAKFKNNRDHGENLLAAGIDMHMRLNEVVREVHTTETMPKT